MYDIPYYIKVDIEGYDGYVLDSLKEHKDMIPRYISVEYEENYIDKLVNLGYNKFQFICQYTHKHCSDWYFELSSSGNFGDYLDNNWITEEELRKICKKDWYDIHATV